MPDIALPSWVGRRRTPDGWGSIDYLMNRGILRRPMRLLTAAFALIALTTGCQAFAPDFAEFGGARVRDIRDRAAQQDTMLALRLDMLLPALMERVGIDCWLTLADGSEGDVLVPLITVSTTQLEGKGALLLCNRDSGLVFYALGKGFAANAAIYEVIEPSEGAPLEALLNDRLRALEPEHIAVNDSLQFAVADGLTASNARWLREHLAPEFSSRLISSRPLVEGLLAGQISTEAPLFAESVRLTVAILDEVLSDQVVVASGTSLLDLDWAFRNRAAQLDVELAYPPRTAVYRPSSALEAERRMQLDLKLQPGDLVFLSSGIRYLGYATRVGRWAYLLPTGETAAPDWANEALSSLADAAERTVGAITVGQNVAEVLDAARSAMVGLVHSATAVDRVGRLQEGAVELGATVAPLGLWDGAFRLGANTALAITLSTTIQPPGSGASLLSLLLIDTALVTADGTDFVVPLQRTPLLID